MDFFRKLFPQNTLNKDPSDIKSSPKPLIHFVIEPNASHNVLEYTHAIAETPNDEKAYFMRAYAYYALRDYAKALADINKVIELDPQNADAFASRANIYQLEDDLDKALPDVDEAVRLKQDDSYIRSLRGLIYGR